VVISRSSFDRIAEGSIFVEVRQSVRDLQGQTYDLGDKIVGHMFHLRNARVTCFDIREDTSIGV
jgi:hypothetical protein